MTNDGMTNDEMKEWRMMKKRITNQVGIATVWVRHSSFIIRHFPPHERH